MSRSSPPSNHSVSTSSTDSDSIEKGKGTRAKARANDESITGAGGTSRTTTSTGVEKSKPKAKRQRSEVWDHFHKFITDSGENKARCNYCERELFADTKLNGTSSLKSHLKSCSKFPRTSSDPAQTELFCQVTEEGSSISFGKYSAEALRRGIAEMIIEDELPFKFVEAKGFRKCMFIACPRFKMPSRWTIARDCYDIYLD
ncbi:PREDICTED: zinc finger BED domain-containing protein RICESLEEPER 3-like isoform X2 [Ipomoea nil]|uniref:zinc finger BED domain-containing protein RICESLEEPER 3-like isoform X2 n=1 Tax=Ipomoea nil TaxID=35883 RepID=UPI000900A33A|nr:PREDICTED: zinc finger BED domain-containing protein RICESLEEPER 3-like isoform X2 [Ipomoea nil]